MILEEDSLLQFSYDITTHILSVTWPDLSQTPLPEIENSLQKLARNIKNFDIEKVMADHRFGFTSLDDDGYKKIVENYHRNLKGTHLKKMARIIPENPAWEYFIIQISQELKKNLNLSFEIRFFNRKSEAMQWLLET